MTLKKIHRIYFGFDGKPDPYLPYLENWRHTLPDYEIYIWNAENLPLDNCQFSREMLAAKDHAFLSDYFRWWLVCNHGGIYLDADIEITNGHKFNEIVEEVQNSDNIHAAIGIDNRAGGWYTGHSMLSKPGGAYARFMCELYESFGTISIWRRKIFYFMSPQLSALYFAYNGHNTEGMGTSPELNEPIVISGVKIYPQDFFSPMTPAERNGAPSFVIDSATENTVLCHHFSCSWHEPDSPYRRAKDGIGSGTAFLQDLLRDGSYAPPPLVLDPSPGRRLSTRVARGLWHRLPTTIRIAILRTAPGLAKRVKAYTEI
ncbi:Glycosyltransferase sugar-binding region containing DXD motif protein [bacterium YEK0313]|nr:Glycosyltransferase sugar-binding region containing DXD motif protein [bacterium YEK0313]